jgi:hypothetical protein
VLTPSERRLSRNWPSWSPRPSPGASRSWSSRAPCRSGADRPFYAGDLSATESNSAARLRTIAGR